MNDPKYKEMITQNMKDPVYADMMSKIADVQKQSQPAADQMGGEKRPHPDLDRQLEAQKEEDSEISEEEVVLRDKYAK